MTPASLRLGVDLGGTKIEIVALGPDGALLARRRVPAPQGSYVATVQAIVELVEGLEAELGARGTLGMGIPGALSPATGLVRNANSVWLIGQPLREDLERRLGRELRIENDANCFAIAEAQDGAGAGFPTVFGVILGTGCGAGLVVNGAVLRGANAIAGEWGHNPLPLPDEESLPPAPCYCGRSGCVETWLSGPGLSDDHWRHGGQSLSAEEIANRAEAGDAACAAALGRYERRLAKALAQVVNVLDPDVVVLGGGLSNIARLYDTVPRLWAAHVFSDTIRTRLLRNVHGDSSGVRGAAWLWNGE